MEQPKAKMTDEEFFEWWLRGCPCSVPAHAQGVRAGKVGDKPGPQ